MRGGRERENTLGREIQVNCFWKTCSDVIHRLPAPELQYSGDECLRHFGSVFWKSG